MEVTKKQIKKFYEDEGARGDHQKSMYCTPAGKPWSKARYKRIVDLIRKYSFLKRFLEVGCAEGLYCEYAKSVGARLVVGMDISRNKIRRCNSERAVYIVGDWDDMPFEGMQFDVALLSECIEHALDPAKLVKSVLDIAEKVIISIPLEKELQQNPIAEKGNGHLHLFTEESFKKSIIKGYRIIEEENDGYYYYCVITKLNEDYLACGL